jgi:predicted PurR-regulated permease PerM
MIAERHSGTAHVRGSARGGCSMTMTTDPIDTSDTIGGGVPASVGGWIRRLGIWCWSFVGIVVFLVIVFTALGFVSEIVLPMTFAAVLAICFRPVVGSLTRRGWKPTLAAGVVVLGLLVLMGVVVVSTVQGVLEQTDEIGAATDSALGTAAEELGLDPETLEEGKAAAEEGAPVIAEGLLARLVSGIDTAIALAGALVLGALIMYYLLKDGSLFRRNIVERSNPSVRSDVDWFIGNSCRVLRDYGKGRSAISGIVAIVIGVASLLLGLPLVFTIMVVNFIGGYIPYIGAFLGGGLAVIVGLGEGGISTAVVMLLIVLAANLLVENFVEPKVMGKSLDIHPLVVLVVTALGGLLGGIVGLILAVPFYVIFRTGIERIRSGGYTQPAADKAQQAVKSMIQ